MGAEALPATEACVLDEQWGPDLEPHLELREFATPQP